MTLVEESGRTVEEAVERALAALGASRDEVEVEILDAGSRGVLGLGARAARVRVTVKEAQGAVAHALTERLLRAMGFAATVSTREREGAIFVDVTGQNLGALIGKHGGTLDAIDLVLGLMVAKRVGEKVRVSVDVEGYRAHRRQSLEELARRMALRAQRERSEVPLAPMESRDRRIVHTTLADHPHVFTYSQGEGALRRVIIAPKVSEASGERPRHEAEPVES